MPEFLRIMLHSITRGAEEYAERRRAEQSQLERDAEDAARWRERRSESDEEKLPGQLDFGDLFGDMFRIPSQESCGDHCTCADKDDEDNGDPETNLRDIFESVQRRRKEKKARSSKPSRHSCTPYDEVEQALRSNLTEQQLAGLIIEPFKVQSPLPRGTPTYDITVRSDPASASAVKGALEECDAIAEIGDGFDMMHAQFSDTVCSLIRDHVCRAGEKVLKNAKKVAQHTGNDELLALTEFLVNHFPREFEHAENQPEPTPRDVIQRLLKELKGLRISVDSRKQA